MISRPFDLALVVAEASLDLRRIRDHRRGLIAGALEEAAKRDASAPAVDGECEASALRELAPELRRLDRYERRALSRRKAAIRRLDAARAVPRLPHRG